MTALQTKTQFPDPAESPWENPSNGLTYEWNGWGWDIVTPEDPADPDKEESPAGSAFTFTFSVCKEADFSDDGSIFFELSHQKDDFSLPLQTANLIKYGAKDINGSTTPLIKDGWDLHIYAEDVSSNDRGGATLGWRTASTAKDEDRTAIGIVQDSINSSITKIEEGSLVQLIFTPKSAEDSLKPEGLRYRYKAVNYGDYADKAGTIGIGTGPDDGDLDVASLIALSAINFEAPDLAGSSSPGFSENEHEIFICALDKDTGAEGTFRVELKDGGQRGYRKGFVNATSWYSTGKNINIELGSEIELIFAPIPKAALEDSGVEVHEGLPDEPYEEGDLYFDTTDDELTLYIYVGDDWVPAAPPVSLDGIQNDVFSLQEAANDVKRQLAYQTIEAQKADTKILDLEEGVADLNKKVDAIEVPEVENLDALKKRISSLESRLNLYEKYERAPATVAWKWKGKQSSTSGFEMRWDNSKFLYISHTPWVGTCRKLDHGKWNEGQAHDINGGLMSFWVYRDELWHQTAIFHIKKYRLNYNGWFQFEYSWWTGQEPETDEATYVSMSGMF